MPPTRSALYPLLNSCVRWLVALSRPPLALAGLLRWYRLRTFWLKPRPGDIYIVTAPKAGTTWAQMILYQLVTGGRGEFHHIMQVSPHLELLVDKPGAEQLLDSLPSPRLLKTHLPYEELRPPADSRIVYVTRNAFDTLLSLYHHECLREGFHLDVEEFVQHMASGQDHWFSHLESWWPHRNDPNVLHLRYEELVRDLEGGVRKIAAFCDIPFDEARLGELLERCGIQYMKQHNEKFDFRTTFYDQGGPQGDFIRKGGVGKGRAQLSPAQQAQVEAAVASFRRRLGITEAEL